MEEKEIIKNMLHLEREMSALIHSSIYEGLRLGCKTDRAKEECESLFRSLKYLIEDMEDFFDKNM